MKSSVGGANVRGSRCYTGRFRHVHGYLAESPRRAQDCCQPQRNGCSCARVSGLTVRQRRSSLRPPPNRSPARFVLYVVPSDGDLEEACADVAFFLAALDGLTQAGDRARGSAVSVARSRSVPRPGAAYRRHVRARAGALQHRAAAPHASWSPRRPRSCRASRRPIGCWRPRSTCAPARTSRRPIWPSCWSTPDSRARIRPTKHGEFAIRGGIVDIFPAGEAHPVRLEFIGDTIETLRTYDPATQRSIAPIDQMAIVPLRDVLQDDRARHALRLSLPREVDRASSCRSATRSTRPRPSCSSRSPIATTRRSRRSERVAPPASSSPTRIRLRRGSRRPPRSRSSAWTTMPAAERSRSRSRAGAAGEAGPVPAGRGAARPRRRLGGRNPPPPRRRRDDAVRGGDRRPRRADDRAVEGIRHFRRAGRARRRCALCRGAGRGRRRCRADSVCPTPACRSTPSPTSSKKTAALPNGAGRRPRRSSPICAISRSATSSSTSITASACSSA